MEAAPSSCLNKPITWRRVNEIAETGIPVAEGSEHPGDSPASDLEKDSGAGSGKVAACPYILIRRFGKARHPQQIAPS